MNSTNLFFSATTAVFLTALCCHWASAIEKPEAQQIGGKIKWTYDYEEGKRLSRAGGKPMFVVFRCER